MRVLDISGGTPGSSVFNPIEIGRYVSPTANANNHVHDITVLDHGGAVGRRWRRMDMVGRDLIGIWEMSVDIASIARKPNPKPV